MIIGDLYSSLDGFVHRNVDRIGRRLDRSGPDARAGVAYNVVFGASFAYAMTMLAPVDIGPLEYGLGLSTIAGSMNIELALARADKHRGSDSGSVRTEESPLRYRLEQGMRSIRLVPASIGAGYLVSGLVRTANGLASGSLDASSLHDISLGAFVAAPAFSSYLRDRDPPAPESDPMLAYLPAPARPASGDVS